VPVGELLKGAARLKNSCVVSSTRDELQPHREFFVSEAARDRERGDSAEIANGAERIGIG